MPEPRLNKRQAQAAETRERMLQAARDVFAERGYQAASVGAITTQADTAHGTFYLYFRNKDDAFAQVLASMQEQIRTESRAGLTDDRHDSLVGVIRGFLVVFVQHRGLMRAFLEGMMLSPPIEANWREMRAAFAGRIAHRLEREQAAGAVRCLDPLAAAQALASMAEWYAFTHLVLGDPTSPPATEEDLDAAVTILADLWYHAVYGLTDLES
jgi:AcrR family transcriptional regulator